MSHPNAHFDAAWLALREPLDRAARDAAAPRLGLAAFVEALPRPGGELQVVDLGAGTGANLRWLAPRLGGRQHWRVLDHDPRLLEAWPAALAGWAQAEGATVDGGRDGTLHVVAATWQASIERRQADLAEGVPDDLLAGAGLVTASALLDLVSPGWLAQLIDHGAAAGAGWLFALSVDGRFDWSPPDPDDEAVAAAYARHQQRDKGFGGSALGPAAADEAARRLAATGRRVHCAESDWQLDGVLQRMQVDGMAQAAGVAEPEAAARWTAWRSRRLAAGGTLRLGHRDVLAWPPR